MSGLQNRIHILTAQGGPWVNNALVLAVRFLPAQYSAWFAERYMSADKVLTMSKQLPASKSAAIVDHLSNDFLLKLAPLLDPPQFRALLASISPEAVSRMASLLVDQRQFPLISSLIAYLSPAAIVQAINAFHSSNDLLNVALHVDDKALLSPAIGGLSSPQLAELLVAAERGKRWPEIFLIIDAMDQSNQCRIGERLAELPGQSMTGLLEASLSLDTWPALLQICLNLSGQAQERLAKNIAEQDEALHLGFLQAAQAHGGMRTLLKIVGYMPMHSQRKLVRMAGRHGIRITSAL